MAKVNKGMVAPKVVVAPVVAPVGAMGAMALALVAGKPLPAVLPQVPAAPVQQPRAIVQRSGGTYTACTLGGKRYNVTAPHNVAAWAAVQACLSTNGGTASVAQLCAAIAATPAAAPCGKPGGMVGYLVKVRALASVA